MIDRRAIVEQVAARHGVVIGEDDPLLTWLAVHDVVIDAYVNAWREVQTEAEVVADARAATLEEAAAKDATAQAARVEAAANDAAAAVATQVVGVIEAAVERFSTAATAAAESVRQAQRRAWWAAVAAMAFPVGTLLALVMWLAV